MSVPESLVTHIFESAVIPTNIDNAWAMLFSNDFAWWSLVEKATEGDIRVVGGFLTLKFKDQTERVYRVSEASCERNSIVLELVSTNPVQESLTAMVHTLRLFHITASNETLFQWSTDFGAGVKQDVVQDSKHKKLEAFASFAKAVKK